ncbi:MAG: SRPBCC domain-containing protein [Bacteroidota bacterium]
MKTTTIQQRIKFKGTRAAQLYRFYMDAALHAAITGYPAQIEAQAQRPFQLYGDYLSGHTLFLIPNQLIVQSLKARNWRLEAQPSILILQFKEEEEHTELWLYQMNVPTAIAADFKKGWNDWYWKVWKAYLKRQQE